MATQQRSDRQPRRLAPGRVPDPLRAHGAWVYLAAAALAGVLVADGRGRLAALAAAGMFFGAFVVAGAFAVAGRGAAGARAGLGLLILVGSALAAAALGADGSFVLVALAALPAVAAAAWLARGRGFLAPGALSCGVLALAVAAPAAARAGGASRGEVLLLLTLLAPFFCWRTWRLARALGQGWSRRRLRRRGLVESALAVAWGLLAVVATRFLG